MILKTNNIMNSPEESKEPLCDRFLPLLNLRQSPRGENHREIYDLSECSSVLQSCTLLNSLKRIKELSLGIPKSLPHAKSTINKNACLPSLHLSMDSGQSMSSVIQNALNTFETGAQLKNSSLLSFNKNLEEALAQKQHLVNHMHQRVSMLEDYCQTLQTLMEDFPSLRESDKLPDSSPETEMSPENSSIITIRSEDIQASSSVLEKSQAFD